MPEAGLTESQLSALFDILVHNAVFAEFRANRYEDLVSRTGPPWTSNRGTGAELTPFPIFQILGLKCISRSFMPDVTWDRWNAGQRRLCKANLSDSYDKGFVGLRKSGATVGAAHLETIARAALAGMPKPKVIPDMNKHYNLSNARELEQAWNDSNTAGLYDDALLDRVIECVMHSPNQDDLPPVVIAAREYFTLMTAHVLYHFLIAMPDGQVVVKMLDIVHMLTPYAIIKKTVRLGSATMIINGMTKVLVAEVNGHNLMKTMMSKLITWDVSSLKKKAQHIEKSKVVPKDVLAVLKDYVDQPRSQHEQLRKKSQNENRSIISVILEANGYNVASSFTDEQFDLATEYLSHQFSIRDREVGVRVLCKQTPDIVTDLTKDTLGMCLTPAQMLNDGKVDMGAWVTALKAFLEDLLKTAKIRKDYTPTIHDFHRFLTKHLPVFWTLLHEGASKVPAMAYGVKSWLRNSIHEFRREEEPTINSEAGTMGKALLQMFSELSLEQQYAVRPALDAHAEYLRKVQALSLKQMQKVIDGKEDVQLGPGLIIPRWHSLLNSTMITPATDVGPLRSGRDVKFQRVKKIKKKGLFSRKSEADEEDGDDIEMDADVVHKAIEAMVPEPDVRVVLDALSAPFKVHLQCEAAILECKMGY